MARYMKKSLSLLLTLVLLVSLLTGLGMQASAAELAAYTADGTMAELSSGAKTAAGVYSISDAEELRALSAWVNAGSTGEGFTFFLTADIDLGGEASPWIPIGQVDGNLGDLDVKAAFFGVFDGQGHSVTGLWIGGDDYTTGSGRYNAANGLFGQNFGTIMNVYAAVDVHTYRQGAAIAGVNFGTVEACASAGSITANGGGGTRGSGGIVGSNYGTVKACWSSATVHNDYRRAGGIVGYNAKEVADMDAHGTWNTRGEDHIAAEATEFTGSVADCFFIGYASSASQEYSGGVAATCDPECTIVNCYWLEGSSLDNVGYYQEAAGATGTFGSDGLLSGSAATLLSVLPDSFIAAANGPYPVLYWQSGYEWAETAGSGEGEPESAEAAPLTVFGEEIGLDALKAYETAKTLVKSGKNGETEIEVKGITALDLIEKIALKAEADCRSLTFAAGDGFSVTVEKPEAGWNEVMLIWDGGGASDESLYSAVNYGGGKQWVSGVITVSGEFAEAAPAVTVCGESVALDALKAHETAKTLVKSGKNGETEVEVKGITATDLIEKILLVDPAGIASLTFVAGDGFSAKVEKPEAGWDEVMLIWDGGGASDESLYSAVNYGGGKQWVSGVVTVEAEAAREVCLTVCLKQGSDGEAAILKEYDKAELQAMAAKNDAGWAYLFYKNDAWAAIVATEVVELDALLADAGAAESWVSGAWLEFTCSDGVYGKSYPSYDDIAAKNLFVGEDGSSLVPAGLAITWNSGNLDPVTAESVAALAATAYDSGSLRFVYGMTEAQFTDLSNAPAGARMPTGVLTLTVVSGEEAPEGSVGTSKDNAAFTDIAGSWAEADILAAAKMGLVKGMGDGLFQPDTALSRAMMAQILYRVVGEPKVAGVSFEDVTEANWYYAPAAWAEQTGIVSDFAQNTFEGRKAITREEIAAMLYRCAAAFGLDTSARADLSSYTDAGEVSAWAQDAMSWAVAAGVMEGRTENTLAPAGTATRAEAVTLLMRVLRIATGQPG